MFQLPLRGPRSTIHGTLVGERRLALTTYSWLKLIHILAAIIAVGTNITYFVWLSRTKREPAHGGRRLGRQCAG
ncbi:MAG: hypothetical protein H0W27_00260 [Actinobacteria bacterium]|nr:hypothetical protein [Actinomycetota bacterium]